MILYKDSNHSYTYEGERYKSVTTFLKDFHPPQDWDEIARKYVEKRNDEKILIDLATKRGLTIEQAALKFGTTFTPQRVREIWKEHSNESLDGGSFFHDYKEIQDSKDTTKKVVYNPLVNDVKTALDLRKVEPNTTYLEMMLYDHKIRLAGQSDKVITLEKTSIIRDYKTTNKDLTPITPEYYNPKKRRYEAKKYLKPFHKIPISGYWDYTIQLSLYGYMLELYGFPPEALYVDQVFSEWLPFDEVTEDHLVMFEDHVLKRSRVYVETVPLELTYLRDEVKKLFR